MCALSKFKSIYHTKTYFNMKKSLLVLTCLVCLFSCKKENVVHELTQEIQNTEAADRTNCNCAINVTGITPPNGTISVVEVTAGGVTYRWNDYCYFIYGGTPEPFTGIESINNWYSFSAPSSTPIDVKLKFISCLSLDGCRGANTNGTLTYKLRCTGGQYVSENGIVTNTFNYTGAEQTHRYTTSSTNCAPTQVLSE
jgi:hypothetical protein